LFLDEWPLLASLLRAVVAEIGDDALAAYARGLLSAALKEPNADTALFDLSIEPLSRQELRVLQLLAAGHSNQRIAETLVVSINTVKTQLKSIYRKLDVANRVEACRIAQRLHIA
jgi:LuxR family maltose regulon positive regulatory protein